MDIKTTTTRSHEIRDGELVIIRKQEGVNGSGKRVTVISEERDITKDDIKKVLDVEVPKNIERINKELKELKDNAKELKDKVKTFVNTKDYIKFKKFLEKETTKKHFKDLTTEQTLKKFEGQIKNKEEELSDIKAWEVQFKEINL